MDKELIATRFAKARETYSREARVQQQVAEKMMHLLLEHTSVEKFHRIVEFGCGTGCYSRLLQQAIRPNNLWINDLCKEMEEYVQDIVAQPNTDSITQFISGDAETVDFPSELNLITSCSTLQWFTDPENFFSRCSQLLSQGGYLAFSTFGTTNMQEISTLTGHGLNYLRIEELTSILSSFFEIIHTEEEVVSLTFDTPLQVLHHLKQTGVTGTEKRMWTRGKLHTFCDKYAEQFSTDKGSVQLTYHPIYIIAKKTNHP